MYSRNREGTYRREGGSGELLNSAAHVANQSTRAPPGKEGGWLWGSGKALKFTMGGTATDGCDPRDGARRRARKFTRDDGPFAGDQGATAGYLTCSRLTLTFDDAGGVGPSA